MKKEGILEYYLYEEKKTGEVTLFFKSGEDFRFKKLKRNADAEGVLNYALNVSQFLEKMILSTNILFDGRQEALIEDRGNVIYRKEFPPDFLAYIKEHNFQKSQPKKTNIEINVFKVDGYNFISTIIQTNEKKKSYLRIKNKLSGIEGEVFNYLKDTIRMFVKPEDIPVYVYTGIVGVDDYFKNKLKNKNVKKRINEVIFKFFNEKNFIEKNKKKIKDLIASHEKDLKRKDEVEVNYALPINKNKILIYTDASTNRDRHKKINKSGYGTIIKQDGSDEIMFELTRKLEASEMLFISDISEGQAIYESLKFLRDEGFLDDKTEVEVRSDSLSNIRKLNNKENFDHVFSEKTLDICENMDGVKVIFRWVKGHSTNKYNVIADKMAKESLDNSTTDLIIKRNEKALLNFLMRKGVPESGGIKKDLVL